MKRPKNTRRRLLAVLVIVLAAIAGYAVLQVAKLGSAWASVDRVSLAAAPDAQWAPTPAEASTTTTVPVTTSADLQPLEQASPPPSVMLFVGSDSRAGLQDTTNFGNFSGQRADVIILAIRKSDKVVLLSVPRDLYVEDTCHGGHHRINEAFEGCGDTNGLAQLAGELESVTGLQIEHAAAVDLAGMQQVVDALGGYQICTDYPLRDSKSGLDLGAGCTQADGKVTLEWIRSRHTEQLVNGSWQSVPGVSDLTRNARERQFLVDLLHRQSQSKDPASMLNTVESVAPYLTIDDHLSLADAASWLWNLRSSAVETDEIPVTGKTTSSGADVLVATVDIGTYVASLS